jgi:hypothetical protein
MMHFHFNEQVVADHEAKLHTQASTYRLVERVPPESPWYRLFARRLRRRRELTTLRQPSMVAQPGVPLTQP